MSTKIKANAVYRDLFRSVGEMAAFTPDTDPTAAFYLIGLAAAEHVAELRGSANSSELFHAIAERMLEPVDSGER